MSLPFSSFLNQSDVRETNVASVEESTTGREVTTFSEDNVSTVGHEIAASECNITVKKDSYVLILLTFGYDGTTDDGIFFNITRNGTKVQTSNYEQEPTASSGTTLTMTYLDKATEAGIYTYKMYADGVSGTGDLTNGRLIAILL